MFKALLLCIFAICAVLPTHTAVAQDKRTAKVMKPAALKRLNLSKKRTNAIRIGRQGRRQVDAHLGKSGKLVTAVDQAASICVGGVCVCSGDVSCNEMFSTVCSGESSGGACSGEPPVCVCTP